MRWGTESVSVVFHVEENGVIQEAESVAEVYGRLTIEQMSEKLGVKVCV